VLAAQTLKIASINGLGEIDKLENDLEDEIRYENRSPAKTAIGRLRRAGQHKVHSKVVLLIVVLLNIIDCLLVISELVLDFLHVLLDREEVREMVYEFNDQMAKLHDKEGWEKPYEGGPHGSDMEYLAYHFLEYVLNAFVTFAPNVTAKSLQKRSEECVHFLNQTAENSNQSLMSFVNATASKLGADWSGASSEAYGACFGPFLASNQNASAHSGYGYGHGGHDHHSSSSRKLKHHGYTGHSLLDVAHKLHYISVAILSVLVLLLIIKVFCSGKRFFRSRMQVFDGAVVLISFTLDIVFIEGLAVLQLEEFIIIIAFLLPWRILRVLNSLIAARHIEVLQSLCTSRGLSVVNGEIVGTRTPKPSKKDHHHSSSSTKHGSSSSGLAGMLALGKLAFQAADALAPISNGYGHYHQNNNNNNTASGSGSDNKLSPANGHALTVSASDNVINKSDHPSHKAGTEITPAGHVKAESDSDIFTIEQGLLQKHGDQATSDKSVASVNNDVESGAEGNSANVRPFQTSVSVESEDGLAARPTFTLDDSSSTGMSPSLTRQASAAPVPENVATPSTLEEDLDSVGLEALEPEPTVAFSATKPLSKPPQAEQSPSILPTATTSTSSSSPSPDDHTPTSATAEATSSEETGNPSSDETCAEMGQAQINESDSVSRL
ncbi:voltage-gated hydrogen channel 1, partial [Plakobranchus ocellatus]